jgi:hypothetical protein
VLTNEDKAAAGARIGATPGGAGEVCPDGLIRSCFVRTQTWLQAGKYLNALVSDLPSRNGWTVGEQADDRSPAKSQRLLNRASWDEAAVRVTVDEGETPQRSLGCPSMDTGMRIGILISTYGSPNSMVTKEPYPCRQRLPGVLALPPRARAPAALPRR